MENKFVKLKELVGSQFTVKAVSGPTWKMWDEANRKMLVSRSPEKDYRKLYQVETDKGTMDLGSGQLGNLLEPVFADGKANIIDVTYKVGSNGKTGLDIRYYFNPVNDEEPFERGLDDEQVSGWN